MEFWVIFISKSDYTFVLIGLGNWDTGINLGIETHWLFRLAVHPEKEWNYSHTITSLIFRTIVFWFHKFLQPSKLEQKIPQNIKNVTFLRPKNKRIFVTKKSDYWKNHSSIFKNIIMLGNFKSRCPKIYFWILKTLAEGQNSIFGHPL